MVLREFYLFGLPFHIDAMKRHQWYEISLSLFAVIVIIADGHFNNNLHRNHENSRINMSIIKFAFVLETGALVGLKH